ncbi:MAG: ribosome assembly RNA-binding protein YhbY [Candidatus Binatia bacterium]
MTVPTPQARLTGTQRKYLRGLAHSLVPVVHVGKAGVNEAVISATSRALDDHELIKVKIAAERDERARMAGEIERGCDAELAGAIGTIAILYRAHADPDKRRIVLPARPAAAGPPPVGDDPAH